MEAKDKKETRDLGVVLNACVTATSITNECLQGYIMTLIDFNELTLVLQLSLFIKKIGQV